MKGRISIPLRYNLEKNLTPNEDDPDAISIPLRYNLESIYVSLEEVGADISIPLRYNLEEQKRLLSSQADQDFNSTKVQFGVAREVNDFTLFLFQFH